MYPAFTLYPNGGAFMLCESLSEFDENVKSDINAPNIKDQSADPVISVINKLKPLYDNAILPMLNMQYSGDIKAEDYIAKFEHVSNNIISIVNVMRTLIVKMHAIYEYYDGPDSPMYDYFDSHIGIFMKNMKKIYQQSVDRITYQYDTISILHNRWRTDELLNIMINNNQILDKPIVSSTLQPFYNEDFPSNYTPMQKTFDSFVELIACVYTNPERLARLEVSDRGEIQIGYLLSRNKTHADRHITTSDLSDLVRKFLKFISHILRQTSIQCYNCICDITDGSYNIDVISDILRRVLMRTVNIFALGTIVLINVATDRRFQISKAQCINDYTDLLMKTIETE